MYTGTRIFVSKKKKSPDLVQSFSNRDVQSLNRRTEIYNIFCTFLNHFILIDKNLILNPVKILIQMFKYYPMIYIMLKFYYVTNEKKNLLANVRSLCITINIQRLPCLAAGEPTPKKTARATSIVYLDCPSLQRDNSMIL